jgi:hypothetical protein
VFSAAVCTVTESIALASFFDSCFLVLLILIAEGMPVASS